MLKGTRPGILRKVQPFSVHGQVSWDVFFSDAEDPDGQVLMARVDPRPSIRPWSRETTSSSSTCSAA